MCSTPTARKFVAAITTANASPNSSPITDPKQERTLTPGGSPKSALPWRPVSEYPMTTTDEWSDGPTVLLTWPCPRDPSGYGYAVGSGRLREDWRVDPDADGNQPMAVRFTHSSEGWDCEPTHYCLFSPPA
jgi:hypothetical protein